MLIKRHMCLCIVKYNHSSSTSFLSSSPSPLPSSLASPSSLSSSSSPLSPSTFSSSSSLFSSTFSSSSSFDPESTPLTDQPRQRVWSPELWPQNEGLNRVKFYRKAVVVSLRWSIPLWRLKNMIVLVKNDFFMGWSSTVFKLDEKWWNFDELWSICGHRLKTWRLTEFSRENARFWSEFGSRFSSTHSNALFKTVN